jgi:hypothetical protein
MTIVTATLWILRQTICRVSPMWDNGKGPCRVVSDLARI